MRRLGLLLVAIAVFILLVLVPFAEGYRRNAGLIENVQSMTLRVVPGKYEPHFEEIDISKYAGLLGRFVDINSSGEMLPNNVTDERTDLGDFAALLPVGSTNIRLFTNGHSDNEVARALKVAKTQIGRTKGKYLMYYGWTVSREAVRLPFSAVVAVSVFLAFVGVVMLIFAGARS